MVIWYHQHTVGPDHDFNGINSFLARGDFHHWLITFTNSLDPDQDRQNVGPDLDPTCLTLS